MSKRVFITGGASGLGRALARRCAGSGYQVCIGDVHRERGLETEAELRQMGCPAVYRFCDVTRESDLAEVAAHLEELWGGVDVVVNNAGVAQAGEMEHIPLADWEWVLDVNLLGVVRGCKVFVPIFKRQGGGHIVNMASIAAVLDFPWTAPYNASKAGVLKLSEDLELELAPYGIQVSVVCPFFVRTRLDESLRTNDPRFARLLKKLFRLGPMSAAQVAEVVFRCLERPRLYVLPGWIEKTAWGLKRFLPPRLYAWCMRRAMAKTGLVG